MAKGVRRNCNARIELARKDAKERGRLFAEVLAHVRRGLSLNCCNAMPVQTIEEFLQKYPVEFVSGELEQAKRDAMALWEGIGYQQAIGSCLGNSRSWFYNMANRYGWRDKIDVEAEHKGQVQVNIVSYATNKQSTHDCEKD